MYTNGEPEITITPLSVEPYLLYIDDVTNEGDRGYWLNLALMDYYEKTELPCLNRKNKGERVMVYDCFQFFNELDILKLRMHVLDDVVDNLSSARQL